jgi:hypothetical protein
MVTMRKVTVTVTNTAVAAQSEDEMLAELGRFEMTLVKITDFLKKVEKPLLFEAADEAGEGRARYVKLFAELDTTLHKLKTITRGVTMELENSEDSEFQ